MKRLNMLQLTSGSYRSAYGYDSARAYQLCGKVCTKLYQTGSELLCINVSECHLELFSSVSRLDGNGWCMALEHPRSDEGQFLSHRLCQYRQLSDPGYWELLWIRAYFFVPTESHSMMWPYSSFIISPYFFKESKPTEPITCFVTAERYQ